MKNIALAALIGGGIVASLTACGNHPAAEDPHAHCAMKWEDAEPLHPLCPDSPDNRKTTSAPAAAALPPVGPDVDTGCGPTFANRQSCYLLHANNMRITVPGDQDELLKLGHLACTVDPNGDNITAADHAIYQAEPNITLDMSQIKYPLKGDDAKYNGAYQINSMAHIFLCPPADGS